MSLIGKWFSKTPSVMDIRLHLKEIEREQMKQRRLLEILAQSKQEKIDHAVECKRAGKQNQVRDIFREIRQVEIDISNANGDLRRISLSKTALTSFLRKAQMLEHKNDHKSLQNLMARFQDKSIQRVIDAAEVDDDTFNNMLEGITGEAEDAAIQNKAVEDPGFAEFDSAISQMAEADDSRTGAENRSKQPAYGSPTKQGSTEHFSLVNDAGLHPKEKDGFAGGVMSTDEEDGTGKDPIFGICLCSHQSDECWHSGRSSK